MGAMGQQCHCSVRGVVAVAVGAVAVTGVPGCLRAQRYAGRGNSTSGAGRSWSRDGAGICGDVPQWISSRDIRISEGGRGRGETTD